MARRATPSPSGAGRARKLARLACGTKRSVRALAPCDKAGAASPPLAAIKTPMRDGDVERPDDPAYANAYFINANSATAPGIVDADRNPVITRSEVYSGVYGRASINLYAFNSNGNKGIACGLNNLQLIRVGEPLGGKTSAENDFASDNDDDFLN